MQEIEWSFDIQVGESGPNIAVAEPHKSAVQSVDRLSFDVPASQAITVSAEPIGNAGAAVGFLLVRVLLAEGEEPAPTNLKYKIEGKEDASFLDLDAPLVLSGDIAGQLPGAQPNKLTFQNDGDEPAAVEVLIGRKSTTG